MYIYLNLFLFIFQYFSTFAVRHLNVEQRTKITYIILLLHFWNPDYFVRNFQLVLVHREDTYLFVLVFLVYTLIFLVFWVFIWFTIVIYYHLLFLFLGPIWKREITIIRVFIAFSTALKDVTLRSIRHNAHTFSFFKFLSQISIHNWTICKLFLTYWMVKRNLTIDNTVSKASRIWL